MKSRSTIVIFHQQFYPPFCSPKKISSAQTTWIGRGKNGETHPAGLPVITDLVLHCGRRRKKKGELDFGWAVHEGDEDLRGVFRHDLPGC
jgi:hypothetical protein